MSIKSTNPYNVEATCGDGLIYFIRVVDDEGQEWRYIGKAKSPRSHLALAKAHEHGWEYDFYPLEPVAKQEMNVREQQLISVLDCNLNGLNSWRVEGYPSLSLQELVL